MKPLHILGLAVFMLACAAAVIEYTVRAMFTDLDGMYSHDDDW